jgi:hypothetical protein
MGAEDITPMSDNGYSVLYLGARGPSSSPEEPLKERLAADSRFSVVSPTVQPKAMRSDE